VRALSTLLLLGLCVGVAPSLRASVSFASAGTPCTGGVCFTSGAFTVTAGAWATSSLNNAGSTLTAATLGQYSGLGLGVCDNAENAAFRGCQTPQHSIDDNGGYYDFVLLTFSQPVTSITLTLNPFGRINDGMDTTYITGLCTPSPSSCSPSGQSLATLDAMSGFTLANGPSLNSGNPASDQSFTITPGGSVNWLLIGANTSETSNYFKLEQMSYTLGSTVPEPATFGMAGAALLGLGLLRAKKKRSATV
jgi:hypothetical protein